MKKIILTCACICLSVSLWAQTDGQLLPAPKFKPHYAGTSIDAGLMFMPHIGSAYYIAPKLRFQATPRLFLNTGLSIVQYNLMPPLIKPDGTTQRAATGAYIFAEGAYLLSERWSVNGSIMKNITPAHMRRAAPWQVPTQTMHFGVDYRVTPNITVGARIGYSSGTRSMFDPYYPY